MKRLPTYLVTRVLTIFYLVMAFLFFLYSFYLYNPRDLLGRYLWPFLFMNTVKLFIQYLIPITVTSVILAYSLFIKEKDLYVSGGVPLPFNQLVVKPIVFFIILAAVYAVLAEGVYPVVTARIEEERYLSNLARGFEEKWKTALENKDYEEAKEYIDLYLVIDPGNREVQDKRANLKLKLLTGGNSGNSLERGKTDGSEKKKEMGRNYLPDETEGMTVDEYIALAKRYYAEEDYFSAHYYASLAYRIDPERRDALRVAGKAWEKITSFSQSGKEREESKFYRRKKEGYTALISNQPVKAYYIFSELKKINPDDADIKRYFSKAREAVKKVSFFIDEAEDMLALPGYRNIAFINSTEDGKRELLYISKLVAIGENYFFSGIEDLKFDENGVVYHLKAPYGKLIGNAIVMLAIDRENRKNVKEAVYVKGNREASVRNLIYLRTRPDELIHLDGNYKRFESLSLAELFRLRSGGGKYGIIEKYIDISILMKILNPFSLLVLALLGISFGWFFRARYLARLPIIAYAFIPFMPLFILLLYSLYQYGNEIILYFVLSVSGFLTALITLVVMQAALLFLAMILVAGQRTSS